jgi:hypothetical protein
LFEFTHFHHSVAIGLGASDLYSRLCPHCLHPILLAPSLLNKAEHADYLSRLLVNTNE